METRHAFLRLRRVGLIGNSKDKDIYSVKKLNKKQRDQQEEQSGENKRMRLEREWNNLPDGRKSRIARDKSLCFRQK